LFRVIPILGSSSLLGLKITDATRAEQLDTLRTSPQHERLIDSFMERISKVETVDQLVDDYELYSFVMKAFDLEDQIFGKAMIKKVLKSNVEESDALINRLTDVRFREMYDELGFGTDGVGNINTLLGSWKNRMVDRYLERTFDNAQAKQNETVGAALEFRRKAADIDSPFDILKDREMTMFMRRVLGLPDALSGLDIDRQAKVLEDAYDLEKLKDPAEVERLVQRYVTISDALDGRAAANNPIVQMMASTVSAGQSFTPITLDISSIQLSGFRAYR
jgi:hypothetical protein